MRPRLFGAEVSERDVAAVGVDDVNQSGVRIVESHVRRHPPEERAGRIQT